MVHSETTTGLLNPIEGGSRGDQGPGDYLYRGCDEQLWRCPIDVKGLGIDFLVSSANKCIQGVPGFGFILAQKIN